MKQVLRFFLRIFHQFVPVLTLRDLTHYKEECDQLAGRYETVLTQISQFMEANSSILRESPEDLEPDRLASVVKLDSFGLFDLREELVEVTRQCDSLLTKVSEHEPHSQQHEELLMTIKERLQSLRGYSDQIEEALDDYESRIVELETDLSQHTLLN